jgi:hypothetical protein
MTLISFPSKSLILSADMSLHGYPVQFGKGFLALLLRAKIVDMYRGKICRKIMMENDEAN